MKKDFKYPFVDERGESRFVRTPIQFFKKDLPEGFRMMFEIPEGKWVAVDVQVDGYSPSLAPAVFDTCAECQKSCDVHNKYWGWSKIEALEIEAMSMGVIDWAQ